MKSGNDLSARTRLQPVLATTDYLNNVIACLVCGYIGLNENNLTLVASSLHPLTTLGIRGYVTDGRTGHRRTTTLLLAVLIGWSGMFFVLFADKGGHGLPHPGIDQAPWLIVCAFLLLLAGTSALIKSRFLGNCNGAVRLDAALAVGASAVCGLSALLVWWLPSVWIFDWFSAIVALSLWTGRLLIWSVSSLFQD